MNENFDIFYFYNSNNFSITNSNIIADKCLHFFSLLDQSFLKINSFRLINFSTNSNELFYLKSSTLIFSEIYLKNNTVANILNIVNSTVRITHVFYFTNNTNAFFLNCLQSNLIIKSSFFKKSSKFIIDLATNLIKSSDSIVKFIKITAINFFSKDFGSIGQLINTNFTCVRSSFALNAAFLEGGVLHSTIINDTNTIKILKSVFFANKALNKGGCACISSDSNTLQVIIKKSRFLRNSAFRGGSFYIENLKNIAVEENNFIYNRAIPSKNSNFRSKGGAFYLSIDLKVANTYDYPLTMLNSMNNFSRNRAEIGGVFYISGIELHNKNFKKNRFILNFANLFGKEWASDTYFLRFDSLEKTLQKFENLPDNYLKANLLKIKSGFDYSDCLLRISGYDRFNSLTINTDEDLLSSLQIIQKNPSIILNSNTFNLSQKYGSICFAGTFKRNELPVELSFEYRITSNFLQRLPLRNQNLFFHLGFRTCDVGDRLTENFECIPCSKDAYSFQTDFALFSEVCKSCVSSNFYCFGGGNYTVKPGYWRSSPNSLTFYLCPNQEACVGDPRNYSNELTEYLGIYAAAYCEVGYKGVLCAECEDNYGYLDGHYCANCANQNYYFQVFGNILLRIIFSIYLIKVSVNMSLSIMTKNPDKNQIILSNLLKIFMNHMQILGFIFSLPISFPKELFVGLTYFLSISPNVSEAFSIDCILKSMGIDISLQYFKLIIAGIYPFFLVFIFFIFVKIMNKIKLLLNPSNKFPKRISITTPKILEHHKLLNKDLFFTVLNLVSLICYSDIAKMTMAMFGCVTIVEGNLQKKLLYADFRIKCDSSYHNLWIQQTGSPIMIFFLFFYPSYIVIKMFIKFINNKPEPSYSFRFSYFYYAYKKKFFFWDFVILIRKLALIFINSFFFSRITDDVDLYPILLVILVFSISFGLQAYCKPFSQNNFSMINGIEEYSLLVTFYTMVIALIYMITMDLDKSVVLGFLFLAFFMNVSFFVVWIRFYVKYHDSFKKLRNILSSR